MKLKLLATAALLVTAGFVMPVKAQNTEPVRPRAPSAQPQPTADEVLQACAQDRADTLPNPYTDVPQNHWAFKAVLSIYYCGGYRGSIPSERVKPFLQRQNPQPQSSNTQIKSVSTLSSL